MMDPPSVALEQLRRRRAGPSSTRDLVHRALPGLLVRSPAEEARAMPKSSTREVIVADFGHQPRLEGFPLRRPLRAPSAGTAGGTSRESGRLHERAEPGQKLLSLRCRKPGGEAHVVQETFGVVEPQEE